MAARVLAMATVLIVVIEPMPDPARADPQEPKGWDTSVDKPITTTEAQKKNSSDKQAEKQSSPAPMPERVTTPTGAPQSIAFDNWLLVCSKATSKSVCELSQTIRDSQNRRIVQLTARRAGPTAFIEIIVPVGVSIPYGVSVDLPNTVKLPTTLVDCAATGCRAVLALDDVALQKIKAAKTLAVTFQDSKSGKVISISGSPNGFEQGVAMLLAGG